MCVWLTDGMVVSHLPFGPTAYFGLSNTVMRHDIKDAHPVSEAYPHLIFEKFGSKLGQRVCTILKALFPVPKEDSKRVMTFCNENDFISFRYAPPPDDRVSTALADLCAVAVGSALLCVVAGIMCTHSRARM